MQELESIRNTLLELALKNLACRNTKALCSAVFYFLYTNQCLDINLRLIEVI